MNNLQKKLIGLTDYFISQKIKTQVSISGINFLYKIRLLVAVCLIATIFSLAIAVLEIPHKTNTFESFIIFSPPLIILSVLYWIRNKSNPLKLVPFALYTILFNVLYFITPSELQNNVSSTWLPFFVIFSSVVTTKIHSFIITSISLATTLYFSFYTITSANYSDTTLYVHYLEITLVIIISYALANFYDYFSMATLALISRYKETYIKEKSSSTSNETSLNSVKLAGELVKEFNNPLAILDGYIFKLKHLSKEDILTLEQSEHITNRMQETLNRMLTLTKSFGQFNLTNNSLDSKKSVDLYTIAENSARNLANKYKSVRIANDIRPKIFYCECDHNQMLMAFTNLIQNACEAVSESDAGWVRVFIKESEDKNIITVVVENSGEKVPEKSFAKLIEPFYTTKTNGKSYGMGLAVANSIAMQHGGNLFMPENSAFTQFAISLPLSNSDSEDDFEELSP